MKSLQAQQRYLNLSQLVIRLDYNYNCNYSRMTYTRILALILAIVTSLSMSYHA